MKEQLITFETAKLAKEKGFDITFNNWGEYSFYKPDRLKAKGNKEFYLLKYEEYEGELYPLVTQSLLQKWLREIHWIEVFPFSEGRRKQNTLEYLCEIVDDRINNSVMIDERFKIYEEVLEKGLQEALKLIKL